MLLNIAIAVAKCSKSSKPKITAFFKIKSAFKNKNKILGEFTKSLNINTSYVQRVIRSKTSPIL